VGTSFFLGAIFFPKRNNLFLKGNILSQIIFFAKNHSPKKNQKLKFKKKYTTMITSTHFKVQKKPKPKPKIWVT